MTLLSDSSIASGGQLAGGPGTMNIFGAIAKGKDCSSAENSTMRVHGGWLVNLFGPLEDLAAMHLDNGTPFNPLANGSKLNTYGNIRNVTFVSGTANVYGRSRGIGTITLNGGNLHIGRSDNDDAFARAIADLENGLIHIDPATGEQRAVTLDASSYQWKGEEICGQLVLLKGDNFVFHVDSSRDDPEVDIGGAGDVFKVVNGYVYVDGDVSNAVVFLGGQLALVNDDPANPGSLPSNSGFWLIRSDSEERVPDVRTLFSSGELGAPLEGEVDANTNMLKLTDGGYVFGHEEALQTVQTDNPYARWNAPLDASIFQNKYGSGLFLSTGTTPRWAVPTYFAQRQTGVELAHIAIGAALLLRDTVEARLTDVKGCSNDPFITPNLWQFAPECNRRIGL
jgi:hypothetical protein